MSQEIKGAPIYRKDVKPCVCCGKGLMHAGVPLFMRVTIQRMGIDGQAVNRMAGMEQFFGGQVGIAAAFDSGPVANPIGEELTMLVCWNCACDMDPQPLMQMETRSEELLAKELEAEAERKAAKTRLTRRRRPRTKFAGKTP